MLLAEHTEICIPENDSFDLISMIKKRFLEQIHESSAIIIPFFGCSSFQYHSQRFLIVFCSYRIRTFYIRIYQQKMQLKFNQSPHCSSLKTLHKATSLPSFTQTASSSSGSIDASDDGQRRAAVKWIMSYTKKVARDTQYLAVSYLHRLPASIAFTEENHQVLAATLLLIASKLNEVYPPKITSLLSRCQHAVCKEDIIELEAKITAALEYNLALENTPYSQITLILGALHGQRLGECDKLLRMVSGNREVWSAGEETLAYAVVYLILPQFVKEMRLRNNQKIKSLAITIYNLYQANKEQYEREKENRGK